MSKSATQLVSEYLDAMESRNLPRARALLGAEFRMIFPGGVELDSLESLVEWSKPRYLYVRKTYERFDESSPADDTQSSERIVYCFGTLAGRWNNGQDFAGIRFIDRFVIKNGLLADQRVWNDMAEATQAAGMAPAP